MTRIVISETPPTRSALGRRSAPRVQLSAPARLVSVFDTHECEIVNLSRSGALIRLARPLAVDACGYLRAGPFESFAISVRVIKLGYDVINGVKFDRPLAREQFGELIKYSKELARGHNNLAVLAARDWVSGIGR
jgi:hypothetical protein